MITTNLHPEVLKFFKEQGTVIDTTDSNLYLYYPFWIKVLPDGLVEIVQWNHMPNDLKEMITNNRRINEVHGEVIFRDGEFKTPDQQLADSLKNSPLNQANKPQ